MICRSAKDACVMGKEERTRNRKYVVYIATKVEAFKGLCSMDRR